jgi:hypothetical protein
MTYPLTISGNLHQKLEKELYSYLSAVVENRKKIINGMEGIEQVHEWYREGKKLAESDIPATIVQRIIAIILQKLGPYLEKLLIDTINIEIEKIEPNKTKIKKAEISIAVKPHVDFVKKVDGKEVLRARITFRFAASAKLENIEIRRRRHYQEGDFNNITEVNVEKFEAPFSIFIHKLTFSLADIPVEPLSEPVELYHKALFKMQDFTYHL